MEEITKLHLEVFGVLPNIIGINWRLNNGDMADLIYESIEKGVPYDEVDQLSEESRKEYEAGNLTF